VNEFDVVRRLSGLLPPRPEEVVVPIGDDCAVVMLGDKAWVAASDMLVEGRHFEASWAAPGDVGYKAVAVNASDVAAMGGTPRFVLVSGAAPDPETALGVFGGVAEACREFGVYPLGGDTTGAEALTMDVAILGELEAAPVLRSEARPGHLLAVTGDLGASAAGLLALEGGTSGFGRLKERHLRPRPRVEAGRAAARLGVGAMIDLSDGLASDVRHVCEMSGVGCVVDLDKLPVSEDTRRFAANLDRDPLMLAATGGEDYELLVSAPERVLGELAEAAGVPVTVVGEVTGSGEVVLRRRGEVVEDLSGWDHFV
jgi:thiamine-monophosphate kinase